jgi:hypothetical protein
VEQVFSWILQEANYAGYLEPEAYLWMGRISKQTLNKKIIPQAAKRYASELMEEVNAYGKKPFDKNRRRKKKSCTNTILSLTLR